MKKKQINILISILLGVIFFVLWYRIVDWQEFLYYLRNFNLTSVLIFSIFYVMAYLLRSIRWKIILDPIYSLKISESFRIFMIGLVINFLIPIRIGEVAKAVILKNKHDIKISQSLPTIFLDKLTDLFPVVLILLLIPLISIRLNAYLYTIITLLFVIFLLFLGFLFFSVYHKTKAIKMLHFSLNLLPRNARPALETFILRFIEGMSILKGRKLQTVLIYFLTTLAVLSEAVYIYFLFAAFGIEVSYLSILFGYTLMNLSFILPTPPAQVGSNQFMWVLIFSFGLGFNENLTSVAVTFSHLLTTIIIFAVFVVSLSTMKIKFTDIVRINNVDKG